MIARAVCHCPAMEATAGSVVVRVVVLVVAVAAILDAAGEPGFIFGVCV